MPPGLEGATDDSIRRARTGMPDLGLSPVPLLAGEGTGAGAAAPPAAWPRPGAVRPRPALLRPARHPFPMTGPRKTDDALARIEQTQDALSAEVAALRRHAEALAGGQGAMKTCEIIEFLDQYRAAEATAAAGFGAWLAQSDTPLLRGGLRVVQLREGAHARLFEERIKELGGSPKAELPQEAVDFLLGLLGDGTKSDAEKLHAFLSRAGDPKVIEQLESQIARMADDEETQSLLRAVIEDERASLELLRQACDRLCS